MTLMNTSYLFLKNDDFNIQNYLETDTMYYMWGFINTIFHGPRSMLWEKSIKYYDNPV